MKSCTFSKWSFFVLIILGVIVFSPFDRCRLVYWTIQKNFHLYVSSFPFQKGFSEANKYIL